MAVLWLRFSDDSSLPASLGASEKKRLEEIYDAVEEASLWNRAATALGMPRAGGRLLLWRGGTPYINWSLVTTIVSCGSIEVVEAPKTAEGNVSAAGGYSYAARATLRRLPALIKSQWCTALYVERRLKAPLPETREERLLESTTLGLALQSVLLRLPKHEPRELAVWLTDPEASPLNVRRTVVQLQAIQKRRTELSTAWHELFPAGPEEEPENATPAFFWDDAAPLPVLKAFSAVDRPSGPAAAPAGTATKTEFAGLPVCAGVVTGRGMPVVKLKGFTLQASPEPPILIFSRARPETVEFFPQARAVLFAEGGALSHACTVAREQGKTCVTGLGADFWELVRGKAERNEDLWLTVDGAAGTVRIADGG